MAFQQLISAIIFKRFEESLWVVLLLILGVVWFSHGFPTGPISSLWELVSYWTSECRYEIRCRMRPSQSHDRLSLLRLPAELRNRVWELALIDTHPIVVDQSNYRQPALLRTCSQIRNEAAAIYYEQNTFADDISDLDFTADFTFAQHAGQYDAKIFMFGHVSRASWQNLVRACKRFHGGGCNGLRYTGTRPVEWRLAARAFDLVHALRHTRWEETEQALNVFKATVAESNPTRWRWE